MKPSASDNPRYVLIATLHAQGRSIRSIARQVGLSRSWVHEIVSGLRCDDDADAELARFNVVDDDECTPPFTFVGMDPERGSKGSVERFVDGTGTPCDIVAIWRADRDEQRLPLGYMTDCNRQVLAAGYVRWIAATVTGSGSGDRSALSVGRIAAPIWHMLAGQR